MINLLIVVNCTLIILQEMKCLLYAAVEQAPSAELVEPDVVTRHFAKFDEQFFHYCDKELAKINTFYSGKSSFGLIFSVV